MTGYNDEQIRALAMRMPETDPFSIGVLRLLDEQRALMRSLRQKKIVDMATGKTFYFGGPAGADREVLDRLGKMKYADIAGLAQPSTSDQPVVATVEPAQSEGDAMLAFFRGK